MLKNLINFMRRSCIYHQRRADETTTTIGVIMHTTDALAVYFMKKSKDTETDVLSGNPTSAISVQKSDGSLKSAIHNAYRISLRPSSMREPRHPLLKVLL